MSDIFVSYAAADRPMAQKVARALEAYGWSVWWDRSIVVGGRWEETIAEALGNAKCVLVLWSSSANRSEWVKQEAAEGRSRQILIPARIENVAPPFGFRHIQTGELQHWNGTLTAPEFKQIVNGVSGILGPPPNDLHSVSRSPSGSSKRKTPSISAITFIGVGTLHAAVALSCFVGDANPLQNFALVILIAIGATAALAEQIIRAEWKSPLLIIGGPAAIFIFVCFFGAVFLHPTQFGNVIELILGNPTGITRLQ